MALHRPMSRCLGPGTNRSVQPRTARGAIPATDWPMDRMRFGPISSQNEPIDCGRLNLGHLGTSRSGISKLSHDADETEILDGHGTHLHVPSQQLRFLAG